MKVKGIIDEDFVNYKKPSMVVMFPNCSFKCDKECGKQVCQNSALATAPDINITYPGVVTRYQTNPITQAIVFAGLEPFDSYYETISLIKEFRRAGVTDDIVIYTGYTEKEADKFVTPQLTKLAPLIIKYGRFIPNMGKHYDEILGVNLASDNQYARIIN